MDRMAYERVSSGTGFTRCPRCNGELDTGYRCVACGWSRYTSSGNVGAYVGAPPISPLPARGALDELLADGDWEGFEPMRERVRAELAALRAENARLTKEKQDEFDIATGYFTKWRMAAAENARLKADIETLINPDPSIGRDTLRLVPIDRLREVYEQIIGEWGNAPRWLGNILSADGALADGSAE